MNQTTKYLIAVAVIGGLALIYSKFQSQSRQVSHKDAFLLAVTVKFKSKQDKLAFKQIFQPLTEYVRLNEPKTLSYVLYDSDKEETQAMIFERYTDKDAYLNIHKTSKPFLEFRSKLQDMINAGVVSLDGHSYIESSLGYV